MINDVTIIIPTRANLEYLQAAIASIRNKSQYDAVKILVGADSPTKEVREWLAENNKGQYDYTVYESDGVERLGIVYMVEDLVERVDTKFVYYMHDDMVIGNKTLDNLISRWEEKKILSSLRVEPPIYDQTPEKVLVNLGTSPEEFSEEKFLEVEQEIINKKGGVAVEGFFAPHFFAKNDWVGYDHLFEPQSREDSDLALRFMEDGCEVITIHDSVVYHFSGKGSRKKDGQEDSEEWKISNYKNGKNYVRKWGTMRHTEYIKPLKAPDINISLHVLVGERDIDLIPDFLERYEHWFNQLVFVLDGELPKAKEHINSYIEKVKSLKPTNFSEDKIVVFSRDLNGDFAAQTNAAINKCDSEWCMKIDLDEVINEGPLSNLRFLIEKTLKGNPNISVIGFPRINTLDGKVVNDIPRQHWFSEEFYKYPDSNEVKNPDVQYRLHKKFERWVGEVHEVPMSVYENDYDRVSVIRNMQIFHSKSRDTQLKQMQFYNSIDGKKKPVIDTLVYDSVIYTVEGITKHAREEVKQLSDDFNISLLDQNYVPSFGSEFKEFYTPTSYKDNNYVTIVNQPPVRWDNNSQYKNRFGYLAFEGLLPKEWVDKINSSDIIELWTPSSYCKEMFEKSGVKKPIVVIPHGIDPAVWKPMSLVQQTDDKIGNSDPFTFLAVGTAHNSRKGFDLLTRAFSEEFEADENVKLLFKVNKLYNPEDSFNNYIRPSVDWSGNTNIEYYDKNLSEEELVKLFNSSDVYVSPHRSEGFGINILNALAVGLPTVVTGATGNMDFCNGNNCLLVDVEDELRWSPFIPPYNRAKWPEPCVDSLKQQLRRAYEEHASLKEKALENSEVIRSEWSWNAVSGLIKNRISKYFTLSD